jgi:hypothetical protein
MSDVVITWLLNAVPDAQRPRQHIGDDPVVLETLRVSVNSYGHPLVVLTDCIDTRDGDGIRFYRVPPGDNAYWHRWKVTADWLADHPEVDRAWAVDGTDVEMLNDPFPHMEPGRLYVGSEPFQLAGQALPWLKDTGRSQIPFYNEHPHLPVLNLGLIGGDRATVQAVCQGITDRRHLGDKLEMGVFQRLIHENWPDRVTGPLVHTMFRAQDRTAASWWRHK